MTTEIDEREEKIKRIKNSIVNGSSVELKINVYNSPKPFYFKGCILKFVSERNIIWFWDIFSGIKKFNVEDIISIKTIQINAFSYSQIQEWIKKIKEEK